MALYSTEANQYLVGDDGRAFFSNSNDFVDAGAGYELIRGRDTLLHSGDDTYFGTSFDSVGWDNVVSGNRGNDFLSGSWVAPSRDLFRGGKDNDSLNGGMGGNDFLHGAWGDADEQLLQRLNPDAVLFVGDLADGDLRLTRRITRLPFPVAVILGNHDRGRDRSGGILEQQLAVLGDLHCAWRAIQWPELPLTIVGARPCSAGGGFHLSKAVEAVYGPVSLEASADRIVQAAADVPADQP